MLFLLASLVGISLAAIPPARPPPSPQYEKDVAIPILHQASEVGPDGTFFNQYETANGIVYEERGTLKNIGQNDEAASVQGTASWPSQDGTPIRIDWQADENGAVFQGDHLPTPPPIPLLIQRALDWLAANPSRQEDDKVDLKARRGE
ncbi:endocuticle structural glycoprotein SgAbd-4-like [Leptopilina heterotoma]|uniref:endocuticle structural glycoprotein SgAbd-4-like n=1 Tax=Leptopilina heterotoma TaxID=63436 RepID=UPI001CA84F95|nr:endocuticle structural glycoprotein SgAbd-4-like [Leptopilina heterotoma]